MSFRFNNQGSRSGQKLTATPLGVVEVLRTPAPSPVTPPMQSEPVHILGCIWSGFAYISENEKGPELSTKASLSCLKDPDEAQEHRLARRSVREQGILSRNALQPGEGDG